MMPVDDGNNNKGKYETKVDFDPVHLLEAEPDDAKKE